MNSLSCRRGFSLFQLLVWACMLIFASFLLTLLSASASCARRPNISTPVMMVTTPSGESVEIDLGDILEVTLRRPTGFHLEEGTYLFEVMEHNGVNWEVGLRKLGKPGFPRLTYFLSDYVFKKETSTYIWVQVVKPTDPQYKDLMVEFAKGGGK